MSANVRTNSIINIIQCSVQKYNINISLKNPHEETQIHCVSKKTS